MIDRRTNSLQKIDWYQPAGLILSMGSLLLLTGGCRSLLTPHEAAYQYDPCHCLGPGAGYTETQWTPLIGCRSEPSTPKLHVPIQEYFPVSRVSSSDNDLLLEEATVVGKAILLKEAADAAKEVSSRAAEKEGREVTKAAYFSTRTQSKTDTSQWLEALRVSESKPSEPTPIERTPSERKPIETTSMENKFDETRHSKQLVEVTVEYLR